MSPYDARMTTDAVSPRFCRAQDEQRDVSRRWVSRCGRYIVREYARMRENRLIGGLDRY